MAYTDTCNYLGNTICSHYENVIIDNAITITVVSNKHMLR